MILQLSIKRYSNDNGIEKEQMFLLVLSVVPYSKGREYELLFIEQNQSKTQFENASRVKND